VISRLDSISEGTVTLESYKYLGLSTVVEEDHPQDGVYLTYIGTAGGDGGDVYRGLDRFGRITDQKWFSTNATASVDEYTYTYDADGNVLSKANPLHTAFGENYTYDNLSRLTAVSRGSDSSYQSFNLNAVGDMNSVTTDGTTQNRTVNSDNQITAIGSSTISYDSNGNITTDDYDDTMIYDAWNRVVGVENGADVLIAAYTYDGTGRMTSKTTIDPATLSSTTVDMYYSGTQEIEDRTGVTDAFGDNLSSNGTVTLTNVYSPGYVNDILLRDTYSGGSFSDREYFTHDANYNVTAAISTVGGVDLRMVYDPYGAVKFYDAGLSTQVGNSLGLKSLYQGMLYDAQIGWYFTGNSNQGRWYSPSMITWIRPDVGYIDGMSLYQFVADNPINLTDATGLLAGAFGTAGDWNNFFGGPPSTSSMPPPNYHPPGFYDTKGDLTPGQAHDLDLALMNYLVDAGFGNFFFGWGSYNRSLTISFLHRYLYSEGDQTLPYSTISDNELVQEANKQAIKELETKDTWDKNVAFQGDLGTSLGRVTLHYKKIAPCKIKGWIHDNYDFHATPGNAEDSVNAYFPIISLNLEASLWGGGWAGGNTIPDRWMANLEDDGYAKSFWTTIEWEIDTSPPAPAPTHQTGPAYFIPI